MDVSLDHYISQKGQNFQSRRGQPMNARLGLKVQFDARQKIVKKAASSVRSPPKKFTDARQKLALKTKFVDARVRIENKKATQALGSTARPVVKQPVAAGITDMRIKINNSKAAKQAANKPLTQVTVRGNQRELQPAPGPGARQQPAFRLPPRPVSAPPPPRSAPQGVRVREQNGSLVRTIGNSVQRNNQAYEQPESTPVTSLPGHGVVHIKNEYYQPPKPASRPPPVRVQVPVRTSAPAPAYIPAILPEHLPAAPSSAYQAPSPSTSPYVYVAPGYSSSSSSSSRGVKREDPAPRASVPAADVMSPTQGYRVLVTNLNPIVSEDDIVELFGAVGDVRKARLMKIGMAEVVYSTREDALAAIRKYHMRELDGQPMSVVLTSGGPAAGKRAPPPRRLEDRLGGRTPSPVRAPPPHKHAHRVSERAPPTPKHAHRVKSAPVKKEEAPMDEDVGAFQPLNLASPPDGSTCRLFKATGRAAAHDNTKVDVGAVHRALFKIKDASSARPVTFTVKI